MFPTYFVTLATRIHRRIHTDNIENLWEDICYESDDDVDVYKCGILHTIDINTYTLTDTYIHISFELINFGY